MEYEKIINLLDNVPNQPSKFRTKNWVETNDEGRGTCNKDIQIQLKNAMLKSSLCEKYSVKNIVLCSFVS